MLLRTAGFVIFILIGIFGTTSATTGSPCPSGYSYAPCFDSCYLVVNTPAVYFTALQTCHSAGAHFFVPNSYGEFAYVTNNLTISTLSSYWFGLQDWARRGSGTTTTGWTFPDTYTKDPDGIWKWMDGQNGSLSSANIQPSSVGFTDPLMSWLPCSSRPVNGTDFVAHLELIVYPGTSSSVWSVVPSGDYAVPRQYVCEYTRACAQCPTGWTKYLDRCYKLYTTSVTYQEAFVGCRNANATLLAPKIESLVILMRAITMTLPFDFWFGLDKITAADGNWRWGDDSALVSLSDALDIVVAEPSLGDEAFRMMPDVNSSGLHLAGEGFGYAPALAPGWAAKPSTSYFYYLCVQNDVEVTKSFVGCGDGILQTTLGEQCDDGGVINGDGCSSDCILERCGDGILQSSLGEQCDDGGLMKGDGCSSDCILERCGDGIVQTALGEQCDDGGLVNGDGCSSICTFENCGNGILQKALGEECDDGRLIDGDGCSSNCTLEVVNRNLDIYFVIDTSINLPMLQLGKVKTFTKLVISKLALTSETSGLVQFGILVFGGRTAGYRVLPMGKFRSFNRSQANKAIDSIIYFGNSGNLSNAFSRLLNPSVFSLSDGHRYATNAISVVVVLTSSLSPDMQQYENQLASLHALGRRLFVAVIGEASSARTAKQLRRLSHYQFDYLKIPHWDRLTDYTHHILGFLNSVI